jgi:Flp pilus assembly protein TadG
MSACGRSAGSVDVCSAGRPPLRTRDGEAGSVTIEAALGLAVLALVLALCLAGIACLLAQLRCADAAREAARLAARGDAAGAAAAVSVLAPAGASLSLSGGDLVTATVTGAPVGGLLPGVRVEASASAAREPTGAGP